MKWVLGLFLGVLLAATPAGAVNPDEILDDPALETRAREISADLRCLVCQNQSIDDSNAPLARDLRILVRERLNQGETNSEIIDYVVGRYGEFVLLNPRFNLGTLLLWLAPPALLLVGGFSVFGLFRKRKGRSEAVLSPEEEAQLAKLLAAKKPK